MRNWQKAPSIISMATSRRNLFIEPFNAGPLSTNLCFQPASERIRPKKKTFKPVTASMNIFLQILTNNNN